MTAALTNLDIHCQHIRYHFLVTVKPADSKYTRDYRVEADCEE
ncbi:hypothetical protein LCGC14_0163200 [marine sediment metagenome]|uniref:Uncharacterized protein n=1 Tax=marine sediment metagenome TaxID=412755 RepID=A0A0F9XCF3_9ZZZZ